MLLHAPWGGRLDGLAVLDAFAGTGALGLEALSRGAASAVFMERDRSALDALRANVAACRGVPAQVLAVDVLRPPAGTPCGLVFLDPPYGEGLLPRAVAALTGAGWIAPDALIVAEAGRDEAAGCGEVLADRAHGAGRVLVWRAAGPASPFTPP